jgi:hypothetical protein
MGAIQPPQFGFIYAGFYLVLVLSPVFVLYIYFIIKRRNYKHKPVLKVRSDWFVEGTLCPKCEIGKIKYSEFRDGTCFCCCFMIKKEYFICFDCKTVYPEIYLKKFIQKFSPWTWIPDSGG